MGVTICSVCGGNNVEHDASSGSSFCVTCGAVLEENTIISELTFGETDSGQAVLHGQFVSEKGIVTSSFGGGSTSYGSSAAGSHSGGMHNRRFNATESRELTIAAAHKRIQQLAAAVHLSEQYVDMAHRWFILALQHNFTRGRRSTSVSAACLYIVCRQEKTSHMLLDFSEVLRMNVYLLGNVFLKLVKVLNLDLPLVDPSLYMGRFASKLEFGEKTQQVANTALRLAARMKRDWIQTGRRPNGICGACILVSGRLYGFQRTQMEIVQVVRVCESTIRKRLYEFADLPSSKLTPQEFHTIWLEHEMDPPIFQKHRQKEREADGKDEKIKKRAKDKIHSVEYSSFEEEEEEEEEKENLHLPNPLHASKGRELEEGKGEEEEEEMQVRREISEILQSTDMLEAEEAVVNEENTFMSLDTDEKNAVNDGENSGDLDNLDEDEEVFNSLLSNEERVIKSQIWHMLYQEYLMVKAQASSAKINDKVAVKSEDQLFYEDKDAEDTGELTPVIHFAARPHHYKRKSKQRSTGSKPDVPAKTPLEAAMNVPDIRRISKKLNYVAFDDLFDPKKVVLNN